VHETEQERENAGWKFLRTYPENGMAKTPGTLRVRREEIAMAGKNMTSKTRAKKKSVRKLITYKHQPKWGALVKRRLALAKAQAEATATQKGPAGKSLGKAEAEVLRRKLMEQAREMFVYKGPPSGASAKYAPGIRGPYQLAVRYIETYNLGPSSVGIGWYGGNARGDLVLDPSNLIYPCPDDGTGHYWSAWFANGQVVLRRYGHLEITGSNFTGKLSAYIEALAQGVADIEPGGYVDLATECYIGVYRPIEEIPGYIRIASAGVIYGGDPIFYPYVGTGNTQGIVSLNPSLTQYHLEVTDARPGDSIETTQIIAIVANRAEVQLGPSPSDCAAGGQYGFLETPPPIVDLEYSRFKKSDVLPSLPKWERRIPRQ
jgi:hypothetical protein